MLTTGGSNRAVKIFVSKIQKKKQQLNTVGQVHWRPYTDVVDVDILSRRVAPWARFNTWITLVS